QALVSVEPNYYWGWQQLAEWYNETNRHAGYLEAASELCRLKPEHPVPLTMRGEARLKTGDRDGGKADLRDALRIAPHYALAAAYDPKVELLAQAGRFDAAAAACRPAALDPPPVTLRGRAAWVEARRGNRSKAVALMKQVVADDPGYLWGWRNLAQWYDAEG